VIPRPAERAAVLAAALLVAGCATGSEPPPGSAATRPTQAPSTRPASAPRRVAAVPAGHPVHSRVEAPDRRNACDTDADCHAGGCSGEVCSAETEMITTCEWTAWPQADSPCGCVGGECIWYRIEPGPEMGPVRAQGEPCPDGKCPGGLRCLSYFGVAGPSGPELTSCEIPCKAGKTPCPAGQTCVTIADGPGRVCRPANPQTRPGS
jgi:eight-cysteine-cluster-containing protein